MKILISEDKRDRLAKRLLTDSLSGMDVNYNKYIDSDGEHLSIEYSNGDGIIMIYGDRTKTLYICEDIVNEINILGLTPQHSRNIIGEWFSEFFNLPVKNIYHVNKDKLQ